MNASSSDLKKQLKEVLKLLLDFEWWWVNGTQGDTVCFQRFRSNGSELFFFTLELCPPLGRFHPPLLGEPVSNTQRQTRVLKYVLYSFASKTKPHLRRKGKISDARKLRIIGLPTFFFFFSWDMGSYSFAGDTKRVIMLRAGIDKQHVL